MDLQKLEAVIQKKLCPKCNIGMVSRTGNKVYTCGYSRCGEQFDFSFLSDEMIRLLMDKVKIIKTEPK